MELLTATMAWGFLIVSGGSNCQDIGLVGPDCNFPLTLGSPSAVLLHNRRSQSYRLHVQAEPGSDPLIAITNLEVNIAPEKVAEMTGFLVDVANPSIMELRRCQVSGVRCQVSGVRCQASGVANPSIMELRRLFLLENWFDTVKFVLCLWGLTYIGSWFNMMTLIILSWVALFTLPLLYKNNKESVDEIVGSVNSQMTEIKDKVMSVIPSKDAKKEE